MRGDVESDALVEIPRYRRQNAECWPHATVRTHDITGHSKVGVGQRCLVLEPVASSHHTAAGGPCR